MFRLTALACRAFVEAEPGSSRVVQKVKNEQPRDVVTELDMQLHDVAARFVAAYMPDTALLSEEGIHDTQPGEAIVSGRHLVVDPLDGTNNYALGMPGYGFMAALVADGIIDASAVVLPEHGLYLIAADGEVRTSQPLAVPRRAPSGSTYYAYPPHLSVEGAAAREAVLKAIDAHTSGIYRSGSACIGLFNLLRGAHAAVVAHEVRIWDALAFLPILHHYGFTTRYRLTSDRLTVVSALEAELVDSLSAAITGDETTSLAPFVPEVPLEVS